MASTKKKVAAKKRNEQQRKLLADVVAQRGSGRAVAEELKAAGYRCSQQSVDAWLKGHWPPRPATQDGLKKLYRIPTPWVRA